MNNNYEKVMEYVNILAKMTLESSDEKSLLLELAETEEKLSVAKENLKSLEILMAAPTGYIDANEKITQNFIKYNLERENNELSYKISKSEELLKPKEQLVLELNKKLEDNEEAIARSKKCIDICKRIMEEK